jgi:hypothetical protein
MARLLDGQKFTVKMELEIKFHPIERNFEYMFCAVEDDLQCSSIYCMSISIHEQNLQKPMNSGLTGN